ncbi:3-hydroxyacyl-CoA dehydrogenase NAD-binding domain-containing protein [Bhargavaea ginsengi]|uniref:3-hydroxyacyl-CoA dehydrogenase family protein n=1 Tax=Bhargavaea ginsengi TaxID=426757 RepID=UPI00203E43ED|nr:3-hydroxyacyl-CoA dehydrogenase NAD-binding domain-containing protein [Bhargavaea ginsengi]MCM3088976.1 3-hydroxyacyl-CoA dehydrogenase NAD-binding domain-containing protein [Bhargavaea ginsengi]
METLSIIGSGTMGHSIALNAAWRDMDVRMYATNEEDIRRAEQGIVQKLRTMADNGLFSLDEAAAIRKKITISDQLETVVDGATFVIEAIPENLELKQQFYSRLEELIGQETILASNTSGLQPSDLAAGLLHPGRFVVTHFWNPAHLVPLVEVVGGKQTSDATIERAMELMYAMQKKPIVVKQEIQGFIGNRLQYALFREAQALLDAGVADKEDIDAAVTYSIGRRLPVTGPLMSADFGGLDVFKSISDYLFSDLSTLKASGKTLDSLAGSGKLGVKSGEGFYDWSGNRSGEIAEERENMLIRFLKDDERKG